MNSEPKKKMLYRYERKFLMNNVKFSEIKLACLLHPVGFQPVFEPRFINNIYLDTLGFDYYYDNVDGEAFRTKYRIRWYGKLFKHIKKPVLEIKVKRGPVGTKYSYPLHPFTLDENFTSETLQQALLESEIPQDIKDSLSSLKPVLLNRYYRNYFLSLDKAFRVTIDRKLKYHYFSFDNPLSMDKSSYRNAVVLEMKYAPEHDQEARDITSFFPFPLTKSSKYLHGVERIFV